MTSSFTQHRWLRPVLLGIRAQLYAFGCAIVGTTVYAMYLAVRVRGTPSQPAINAFAAHWSPWIMAIAGVAVTWLLARRLASENVAESIARALILGVTSAAVSLIPVLVLRGRPGVRSLLIAACVMAASWIGTTFAARPDPPQT